MGRVRVDISEVPFHIRAEFARKARQDAKVARLAGNEAEALKLEKEAAMLEGHEYDEKREVSEDYVKETLGKAGKKLSVKS